MASLGYCLSDDSGDVGILSMGTRPGWASLWLLVFPPFSGWVFLGGVGVCVCGVCGVFVGLRGRSEPRLFFDILVRAS